MKAFIYTAVFLALLPHAAHATASAGTQDREVRLQDIDTDGDGVASPDETARYLQNLEQTVEQPPATSATKLQAAPAPVPAGKAQNDPADLNGDGIVSEAEKATYEQWVAQQARANLDKIENPYADKDEKDSKKLPEFQQKKIDMRVEDMKALDINKDGILQDDEIAKSAAGKFQATDTDGDGVLSQAEIDTSLNKIRQEKAAYGKNFGDEYSNRVKNRYKNADTNHDGKLSGEEYQNYSKQYETGFDRDGDGIVSKEEFRSEGEKLPSSYFKEPKEQ